MKRRVAILISGRGSNMHALLRACAGEIPDIKIDNAEIALVISNKSDAGGLAIAQSYGVETKIVPHNGKDRKAYDAELTAILQSHRIDFICLAGFMRLLSPEFVETWHNRLINIHPSLLPEFKGLDTHRRALEARVPFHGCTVHFVRAEMDAGPIILQEKVPVLPRDSEQTLSERVLQAEHRCYPQALKLWSEGKLPVTDDTVVVKHNHRLMETPMAQMKSSNANDPYLATATKNYHRFIKLSAIGTGLVILTLVLMAVFLV